MALRRFHGTESHAHNHATSATGVQKDERLNNLHGNRDDIYIYQYTCKKIDEIKWRCTNSCSISLVNVWLK